MSDLKERAEKWLDDSEGPDPPTVYDHLVAAFIAGAKSSEKELADKTAALEGAKKVIKHYSMYWAEICTETGEWEHLEHDPSLAQEWLGALTIAGESDEPI